MKFSELENHKWFYFNNTNITMSIIPCLSNGIGYSPWLGYGYRDVYISENMREYNFNVERIKDDINLDYDIFYTINYNIILKLEYQNRWDNSYKYDDSYTPKEFIEIIKKETENISPYYKKPVKKVFSHLMKIIEKDFNSKTKYHRNDFLKVFRDYLISQIEVVTE